MWLLLSTIHPPAPSPADPLICSLFRKAGGIPNKPEETHSLGEVLNQGLPYSLFFYSPNVLFLWAWRSGFWEGAIEEKAWLPGRCVSLACHSWQDTRHLLGFYTSQPPVILLDKWDKERKNQGTVQSIDGPYGRTKVECSRLTKKTKEYPWGPGGSYKMKIYWKFRQENTPRSGLSASYLKKRILHHTGKTTQYSVMTYMRKESKKEWCSVWGSDVQLCPTLCEPTRLLCPWDSSGKNSRGRCHFLLQGIFTTQGSNPCLLSLLHRGGFFTMSTTWEAQERYIYPLGFPAHSSMLAWRIPWTEEPSRLIVRGVAKSRRAWSDLACMHVYV